MPKTNKQKRKQIAVKPPEKSNPTSNYCIAYRREIVISFLLVVLTLSVYWPVGGYDFINFDDPKYVTECPDVLAGLSLSGITWAFTSIHANFWHPLTTLSYMTEVELFGPAAPGMHHLVNLILHIMNTLLLFLVLRQMTGASWRSAFVAAVFALHPLHVQSVAWISQRKDLLSTIFWILTMGSYAWYARRPGISRYLTTLGLFVLGMMAKPMLVTLPCVLLLLDYWPLKRLLPDPPPEGPIFTRKNSRQLLRLVWEKIPFFIITIGFSVLAYIAQSRHGVLGSLTDYPVAQRISNALVSYAAYIIKMVYPVNLILPYQHPGSLPLWQALGAGGLLVAISVSVIMLSRRYRYLMVGWLWYLGTLVPVIGLIQVGSHGMADRYTYVPLIGLFILIAWAAADLTAGRRYRRLLVSAVGGISLLACAILAYHQIGYWKNTVTLFTHTINIDPDSYKAQNNLGTVYLELDQPEKAAEHFLKAAKARPDNAITYYNVGLALLRQGKTEAAFEYYRRALAITEDFFMAHSDMGNELLRQQKWAEAISHLTKAVRIAPDNIIARNNLANALAGAGDYEKAIQHYVAALNMNPEFSEAYYNLGNAFLNTGRLSEAITYFAETLKHQPNNYMAHNNMANTLVRMGLRQEALNHYQEALRVNPEFIDARLNLGILLTNIGEPAAAAQQFRTVLRLQPDNITAQRQLAKIARAQAESVQH